MTCETECTQFDMAMELLISNGFDGMAETMKILMDSAMKIERCRYLQAEPYERTAQRQSYANVQILSGLITYLLPAIYCHEKHGEPVSISRVRQLRHQIRNETNNRPEDMAYFKNEVIDRNGDSKIHMQFPNRTMLMRDLKNQRVAAALTWQEAAPDLFEFDYYALIRYH